VIFGNKKNIFLKQKFAKLKPIFRANAAKNHQITTKIFTVMQLLQKKWKHFYQSLTK
jgi:hypothetical protein